MPRRDDEKKLDATPRAGYSTAHVMRAAVRSQLCGSYPDASNRERWFCFRTTLGQHEEAVARLDSQGFLTFFPLFRSRQPSGKIRVLPLFPRYGFIRFDADRARWRVVFSTRGVETILGVVADRPTPIPVGVVESLLGQLSVAGLIDDPDLKPDAMPIEPGVFVRVKAGPFTAMRGICQRSTAERVTLLLDLFGRGTEVEIGTADVEPDDDAD